MLALGSAVVAAFFVTIFSIDLSRLPGVDLPRLASEQASNYLERPAHIGHISALLTPGDFAIDDVVIEGRNPGDRPFMHISRVVIHVPWWTIFKNIRHPEIHVQVHLTDWQMVIESWEGGLHNIPKLTPKNPSTGPKRFTTTVDFAYATGGHFIFEDHGTPWRVDAPNLDFALVRATSLEQYVGTAAFHGGAVQILSYRPMATDLRTRFVLDGPQVQLTHIDLRTEGTTSHVNGHVDFSRWPEQVYNVNSDIDFAPMREIFFPDETWRLGGKGHFIGSFKMSKEGGQRELEGNFSSDDTSVNDLEFHDLHGGLIWANTRFAVTHAESELLGGRTRFEYGLAPLGTPNPATATFAADYSDVDLFELDRLINLHGLRLAGQATGSLALEWQNGHFGTTRRGLGHTNVTPPAGVALAPTGLPDVPLGAIAEPAPFDPMRRVGPLTVGGDIHYRFDPEGMTFEPSWSATSRTYIAYRGRMARDGSSEFPFQVTSHDWQESDRLLAAIMTAVSGPTGAVEVGGRGTFDGVMTGSFSAPRIAGRFTGDDLRVWDVTWGRAVSDLVIENKYVDITKSLITGGAGATIVADGHYSLGFRQDDAEEIRAQVHLSRWPLADLRHAFGLDDWPMEGTIGQADLDLRGRYKTMFGAGTLRIDEGRAWKEGFQAATGEIALEGTGLRISRIEMKKGTGTVHAAARIGWDGTYAFNADAEGIPVESLDNFQMPQAPLTGRLKFRAVGASTFDAPTYSFDGSIDDLYVGSEGIGSVTGRMSVSNKVMTFERLVAASSRLQVFGTGTIAFDDNYTSDLRLRFSQTALDPYLKFVMTDDISPYTRVVVGGSLSVRGPLGVPQQLLVDASVDDATLTLLDYDLNNDGPIRLRFENGAARIDALTLKGRDTNLSLTGGANTTDRTLDLSASGDASLSILQAFPGFKNLTTSGATRMRASLTGSFDVPRLTGEAVITDGRLRPFGSPHSLESINGRILITPQDILLDGVTGRIGSGNVEFGGGVTLDGFRPSEFNLTAQGRAMRLRYPAGFDTTVDMTLGLSGAVSGPRLSGTIDVVKIQLRPQGSSLFGFCGFDAAALASTPEESGSLGGGVASTLPIALDIQVTAPRLAFVDTKTARVEATADLQVRGTFDAPEIAGEVGIKGGEMVCNGNRFFVQEGSIDFGSSGRFEPVFDLAAETRPRLAGQIYTVEVRVGGRLSALAFSTNSEPYLPETDRISLLMGGTVDPGTAETRALGASQAQQQRMIQSTGATLLASPLTSLVGSVFERTPLDTVQITPVLGGDATSQQLSPTARITLGKRISPRVFLTYSRTLSGPQDEVYLLEYEQSDRLSWVLSRNEDHTFSLDFRIRYAF
jgi:translocation and assembly module TamB